MITGEATLEINQGATWTAGIIYKVNGVAQDLAGCTARCQIKEKASGPVIVSPICTIPDPATGNIHLELSDEDTWLIPCRGRTYKDVSEFTLDVVLYKPDGTAVRILNCIVHVSPGITRPEVTP